MTNTDQGHSTAETDRKNTVTCRYCGSEITLNALLCPICKYWQAPCKNHLTFLAGLAGLIAILGTAGTYIYQNTKSLYCLGEIRVVNIHFPGIVANPNGEMIIVNSGHNDILITSLQIYLQSGEFSGNATIPVTDAFVKQNTIKTISLPFKKEHAFTFPFIDPTANTSYVIRNSTGQISRKLLQNLVTGKPSRCVFLAISSVADPDRYRENAYFAAHNLKEVTIPVQVNIAFTSAHAEQVVYSAVPNVAAVFVLVESPGCNFTDWTAG